MKNQKSRRPRRDRGDWQSLVDAFERSNLDLHTFCNEQAVNPGRLAFWRRRLKLSPVVELPASVQQPLPERKSWEVELTLGQDVTLRLRTH